MTFNTLFLACVVLAFGSLMVTLMGVSIWSNRTPAPKPRRVTAVAARRPSGEQDAGREALNV